LIITKGKYTSEIKLEDLSLSEYHNFLKIKQLPSYELEDDVFKINTEYLYMIDKKERYKEQKINWNFPDIFFDYQCFITKLAFLKRKFAVYADCGLGKTNCFFAWIELVKSQIKDKKILIVSPFNIIDQTLDEQEKFYNKRTIENIYETSLEQWIESGKQIGIINYDKFRKEVNFKNKIGAIVLDESSILKSEAGVIRTNIINASKGIDYKLCCTATPAPNDRQEYANHALFLDQIRTYQEFFHRYFINKDAGWVLKSHAKNAFYKYLASFSIFLRSPKNYGFEDNLKDIPKPIIKRITIPLTKEQNKEIIKMNDKPSLGLSVKLDGITNRTKFSQISRGFLYLDGKKKIKRINSKKPDEVIKLVNKHSDEQIIIWINFDEEGKILEEKLREKSEDRTYHHLSGSTNKEKRKKMISDFKIGKVDIMISKPRLLGFGLNFQNCSVMIFSGINDSYEQYYQSLRRVYRYGNTKQLKVYLPVTKFEDKILQNVLSKQDVFDYDSKYQEKLYRKNLIKDLKIYADKENVLEEQKSKRERIVKKGKNWTLIRNDNIEELENMKENSIDFSIFSPPFASLFTYSSDIADQGNSGSDEEFTLNYRFFAKRLLRVMKPGRKVCVHVSQLPILKSATGYSGIKDFRGLIYEAMSKVGFQNTTEIVIFNDKNEEKIIIPSHGEIAIKKNQQMQSIVKHAPGLSMSLVEKDGTKCMPCFNDYILIFTKPGENEIPVTSIKRKEMSRDDWIVYASGCWMVREEVCDIREHNILRTKNAKNEEDVKHICPLQLEIYRRLYKMYSNPDELILEPFNGIASGGVVALELGRKYLGLELKKDYFNESVKNLKKAEKKSKRRGLIKIC